MIALLRARSPIPRRRGRAIDEMRVHRRRERHHATELSTSSKFNAESSILLPPRDEGRKAAKFFSTRTDGPRTNAPRQYRRLCSKSVSHRAPRHPLALQLLIGSRTGSTCLCCARRRDPGGADSRDSRCSHTGCRPSWEHRAIRHAVLPDFSPGALLGKLMGIRVRSTRSQIVTSVSGRSGRCLRCVLAGAIVTYGGVSLFVAFFVLAPMAHQLFARPDPEAADVDDDRPRRRPSPCRLCRNASDRNTDPDAFFGTTPVRRAGLQFHRRRSSCSASACGGFARGEKRARKGEAMARRSPFEHRRYSSCAARHDRHTSTRRSSPGARETRRRRSRSQLCRSSSSSWSIFLMSLFVLPGIDACFLSEAGRAKPRCAAVGGVLGGGDGACGRHRCPASP